MCRTYINTCCKSSIVTFDISSTVVVSLAVVFSVVTQRRPSLLLDYTMSLDAIRLSFDVNVMLNLYSFFCKGLDGELLIPHPALFFITFPNPEFLTSKYVR